jgi:hypothetical protein
MIVRRSPLRMLRRGSLSSMAAIASGPWAADPSCTRVLLLQRSGNVSTRLGIRIVRTELQGVVANGRGGAGKERMFYVMEVGVSDGCAAAAAAAGAAASCAVRALAGLRVPRRC